MGLASVQSRGSGICIELGDQVFGAQVGIAQEHPMIAMAADQGHLWQHWVYGEK